jgi:uroporphyrin-3 C-methyltransferase/uroporphyrinogen III methyltransferase/synthase
MSETHDSKSAGNPSDGPAGASSAAAAPASTPAKAAAEDQAAAQTAAAPASSAAVESSAAPAESEAATNSPGTNNPGTNNPATDGNDEPAKATTNAPDDTDGLAYRRPTWRPRMPRLFETREGRLKFAAVTFAALFVWQWWSSRIEVSDLRREVAQRLQSGENLNSQTKLIADRVDDDLRVLQGKVSVLEAKQLESQSQQIALEQLYRDLAKNRDDWALAEIEQVLSTASQQLQLAGNVRGALIALQNADARLSRADRPQFIAIRRAIAQDMDKLKSLPSGDLTGVAVRLDTLIAQIDGMPLLSDERPAVVAPPPKTKLVKAPKSEPKSAFDWRVEMQERWNLWSADLWNDIRQLVRVRTVTTPDALLLSPGESFFARENLKLRLLNARMALLSRNDAAFRSDLAEADRTLQRYFDTRARSTQAGRELIKQLQESALSIEMPTLSASLAAVRQSRTRP